MIKPGETILCEKFKGKFYVSVDRMLELIEAGSEDIYKRLGRLEDMNDVDWRPDGCKVMGNECLYHLRDYFKSLAEEKPPNEWDDVTYRIDWRGMGVGIHPGATVPHVSFSSGLRLDGYLDGEKLFEWRSDGLWFRGCWEIDTQFGPNLEYEIHGRPNEKYKLSDDGKRVLRRKT